MEISERIKWELQNPRSIIILVLLMLIGGMFWAVMFRSPTMGITGKVMKVNENGNAVLENVRISDKNLINNEFEGRFVVIKVRYVRGSTKTGAESPFRGGLPENIGLAENFGVER